MLNEALQENLDYLQELLDEEVYEIQGFNISLLVKNTEDETTGYVINYEALEFLKLIAVLDIAKTRVILESESRLESGENPGSSGGETELDEGSHEGPKTLQ